MFLNIINTFLTIVIEKALKTISFTISFTIFSHLSPKFAFRHF